MSKIVQAYFGLLKIVIVACLAAMVIMVFSNVVLRYAFNSGLAVSEELSRWAFVWMIFLGSIVVVNDRAHLGVDIVIQALGPRKRKACLIISNALMVYASWLILLGSIEQTKVNIGATAPASGLSQGWFFSVGIVFSVSSGIILLYQLYMLIRTPSDQIDALAQRPATGAEL
ncbi:TRAP transporter small permease [Pusillimonas sp. SM2304]|uniref:TRAP transporter small permease n=1 Tax=Pusillimonas sp. SM2304 TaxID=3073241 RepID=UPI002875BAAF|nr:TRAP transporter small permease [Pusillimonas sp. SM2304]MDS1139457.1 TRAP transporter small permease [Pusillimonas sp. SM2304]